jgi:RNA polymerase sigma-70 factor (ECF subfamily)
MAMAKARARVDALVRECRPVALQMARSVCGNGWGDPEDLVQETFERALKNAEWLATLSPSEFQGWLYRSLHNRFIDLCRRRKTELAATPKLVASEPESVSSPEERYLRAWGRFSPERFRQAVESLDPKHRKVLELQQVEGLKHREIAAQLKVPQGSVGYWIAEAKKRLAEYYFGESGEKP